MKQWEFSLGFYPGILIGMRTYYTEDVTTYVLYLPFVDFALAVGYDLLDDE